MEIEGKVISILPIQTGIGKNGNSWALQQFVIETKDQYPRKVIIDLFGEDRVKNNPVDIDDDVKVSYDLESREFNGRWYTAVRAWKVEKNAPAAPETTAAPDPFAAPEGATDLFGTLPGEENVNDDPFASAQ